MISNDPSVCEGKIIHYHFSHLWYKTQFYNFCSTKMNLKFSLKTLPFGISGFVINSKRLTPYFCLIQAIFLCDIYIIRLTKMIPEAMTGRKREK